MEKFRSKILACFLAVALVVLTTPISLNFDTSNNSIDIQTNKAHAVVPVAGAAAAFLAEVAAASGLTVSEFIATVAGVSAVGVGMGIATDAGINYGNSASVNLDNLIDAADYPAWDTLSAETQEAWGTKENYDSAKFNSLLGAFDLGDARDRYYSGGGNIDYTEEETSILTRLGRIGSNWINNGSNTVSDLLSTLSSDSQAVYNTFYGVSTNETINSSDVNGWTGDSFNVILYKTAYVKFAENRGSYGYWYYQRATGNEVYTVLYRDNSTNYINTFFFSKSPFMYGYNAKGTDTNINVQLNPVSLNRTSSEKTWNDNIYYTAEIKQSVAGTIEENNLVLSTGFESSEINSLAKYLLFNEDLNIGQAPVSVQDYPEDVSSEPDQQIYFPALGINQNMNWNDFTEQPETPPDSGGTDLTEVIELLQRFHFTVDYNLLVQDNPLRSAVMELVSGMNRFSFYAGTGQLKVHDEGVFDAVGDLGTYLGGLLNQIQATLSGFFVTDTATDVIGDLDFPDLGDKAVDLVDTISTLAPFGAMFLISELVAILSQVGKIQTPSMVFDFNFMPEHEYNLTVDLSWLADAKPIINVACILTLIVALAGTTARLIELEAAA